MTRVKLKAAAKKKYPIHEGNGHLMRSLALAERAAYIQGRLDQAEADAQIAEGGHDPLAHCCAICSVYSERWYIAVAIREGVE